jgi:hypothetical protein
LFHGPEKHRRCVNLATLFQSQMTFNAEALLIPSLESDTAPHLRLVLEHQRNDERQMPNAEGITETCLTRTREF